MKIKHKLSLAFVALFSLIVLLGGIGSYYLYVLSVHTDDIINDNYRTLQYVNNMDDALDQLQHAYVIPGEVDQLQVAEAIEILKQNLQEQESNLTETGESSITLELSEDIEKLINSPIPGTNYNRINELVWRINQSLSRLYDLNQDAVIGKYQTAKATAQRVLLYMALSVALAILLSLLIIIRIIPMLTRPIKEFSSAIKQVANGNFNIAISSTRKDEFGEMASAFTNMANKLKEYEQSNYTSIVAEKNRLKAVINQMSEPIIGLDQDLRIVFINKHATEILNVKEEDLIGMYSPDVAVTNKIMQQLIKELMIPFETWEKSTFSSLKVEADGKSKLYAKDIVEIVRAKEGDQRNVLIGFVIILTDITEYFERDRAKTRFMATLSHELKTPVAVIDMGVELLQNDKSFHINSEQQEWLDTIAENNLRIKRTINEIMDITQIERGMIEVKNTSVRINNVLDEAIHEVMPLCTEKSLKIDCDYKADLPPVKADQGKLHWIFSNILTNAIHHSPTESTITVTAMLIDNESIRISIKDQGPGISVEDQETIFEPFRTRKNATTQGMGLGLSIAREYVRAMGGKIGLVSSEGRGAEFWILLRIAREQR